MIVIAGTIEIDPEQREVALNRAKSCIDGALTQPGCEAYTWSADLNAPERIEVFERWSREEDLRAHFAGPHYKAMLETMGAHGLRSANVSKYRVDLCEPVYGPEGKPRADFLTA